MPETKRPIGSYAKGRVDGARVCVVTGSSRIIPGTEGAGSQGEAPNSATKNSADRPLRIFDSRWRYGITSFALLVAWLILTAPWWLDGRVIPYDSVNHFYAMLRGVARHLAAGDWPAWLPETYAGRPTLADPQALVVTPSLLALAWISPAPSIHAMDFIVHAHLLIGAGGLAALGLRNGAHPLAALLGALLFAFGGAAMARSQHTLLVLSYAWLPIAMLAVARLLERPNAGRAVVAALVLAVLTVNRDHVALLGHFVVVGYALVVLACLGDPLRRLWQALPSISLAVAIWLALIALPLLASIAYVADSTRPGFAADTVGRYLSLPWVSLFTLPFPNLFSTLDGPEHYWGPGAPDWTGFWFDYAIVQIAVGVVPVVLLLWLGLSRGFLAAPGARFGAVVALLALLYALGLRTPFFAPVFSTVPGLDLYQRPADATFILNFGLALALLGVADRYLREGARVGSPKRLWLEAAGWIALVAGAVALAAHRGHLGAGLDAVLVPTMIAALTVGALVWGGTRSLRAREAVVGGLIALTMVDLAMHTAGTPINARSIDEARPLVDPAADPLAAWLMARMPEIEATEGAMRVEMLGLGGAWQNAALALGVDDSLGYNPLRTARYQQATGARQNSGGMRNRRFGDLLPGYDAPFLDVLGVRYIVLGAPMETIDPDSVGHFPAPQRIGHAWVYENADAAPRLVLVAAEAARPHDPEATLASGALPAFDPRHEALIEGAAPPPQSPTTPFRGTLQVLARGPDRVHVRIDSDRAGWLVFHEMGDPGWAAWVDGDLRPLHRANVLFQAVAVEAGASDVIFTYASWRAALAALQR